MKSFLTRSLVAVAMASALAGCAPTPVLVAAAPVAAPAELAATPSPSPAPELRNTELAIQATDQPGRKGGPWIGAAGDSDFLLAGTSDTVLGVWVDVPSASQKARAPADVAVVIDVSGSMAGAKIENARAAARDLVEKLADGDIVSISVFSDEARVLAEPTVLDARSRASLLRVIAGIQPSGGTNMFDGLRLAESEAASSPPSHPVRRVVMISDGMANIGPSSPEVLGQVASRGADRGVQVSAIGVGLDYDEHTLNALAVRSSGRLYHLDEPRDMVAIFDQEIGLLRTTAATSAFVEVVPAPGVDILGADGIRIDRQQDGTIRVPLGTMFGGQHREMVLRVRVRAQGAGGEGHALASVRLHFRDPGDGGVERVQEVVARYQVTTDKARVEAAANEKTRTIVAAQIAAQITASAAREVTDGKIEAADKQLAEAETKLKTAAAAAKNEADRQRVMASAARVSKARAAFKADAFSAPGRPMAKPAAPAMRARALELNNAYMKDMGF